MLKILFFASFAVLQLTSMYSLKAQIKTDSCEYVVEGTIYDVSTKAPLPFATVQLKGTTIGAVADVNGNFRLDNICTEEFDLEFSHVGYKDVVHHHDVSHKLPKIFLAPDGVTLQGVIIEGETTAGELLSGTISGIEVDEILEESASSLGDIASRLSGVSVIKTGQNIVKPVIHGLHSNRILIINDGVRHEYQSWAQDHAPEIDPSMAESISVIKGAATVRYGPDALGGVLLIDPARMELLQPVNGDAKLTLLSNGRAAKTDFRVQKGFHKLAFLAEGSFQKQGDLKAPDYFLSNTSKEEYSLAVGTRYHVKNFDLRTRYSLFEQNLGYLRGSVNGSLEDFAQAIDADIPNDTEDFNYTIESPRQNVKHEMIKLNGQWSKKNSLLEFQYAFQSNVRQEYDVRRGNNLDIPSINLELFTQTFDLDWKHPSFNGWSGTIGTQFFYQDNNNIAGTNTVPFVPNFNNTRIGLFIIESKDYNEFTLEWGVRGDYQSSSIRGRQPNNDIYRNEMQFQNVTATFGFLKDFGEGATFRSNIGSAWRPPSISELYSFGRHQTSIEYGILRYNFDRNGEIEVGDILTEENKDINSEVGLKWTNTYTKSNENYEIEITGYFNYLKNYIFSKPAGITQSVRGAFPYFIYDQTDALFAGVDINGFIVHSGKLSSDFSLAYLYARDKRNEDYFVEIPPPSISYNLNYRIGNIGAFSNLKIGVGASYTFEALYHPRVVTVEEIIEAKEERREIFKENDKNFDILPPPEGYFLANISLSSSIKSWNISASVNNLLNTNYRTYTDRMRYYADDIGRNFILSLRYNF